MTKDLIIMALGALVALVPFLGFPSSWDRVILIVSGVFIIGLTFLLRHDLVSHITRIEENRPERKGDTFVENGIKQKQSSSSHTARSSVHARRVAVSHESHHDDEKKKEKTA